MNSLLSVVSTALVLLGGQQLVHGAISADEITSLPGWQGALPSKQYSGYLKIPNSNPARLYHYWLVECEENPSSAPIVFWYNGGPGASSLLGFFTEHGPFLTNDYSELINSTEVPVLFYNNYTWAKVANMVYIEMPAGIGFSYCDGAAGPMDSCPDWTDQSQAEDNHAIIQQFFQGFPEYMSNDFYISGESYGGVYVPSILMQIENDPSGMPPLKGMAIGDGCMGNTGRGGCNGDSSANFFQFMWGHGQMSNVAYYDILNQCGNCIYYGNCSNIPDCHEAIDEGNASLGGFNIYNIYDECYLIGDEATPPTDNDEGIIDGRPKHRRWPHVFRDKNRNVRFNLKDAFNGAQKHHTSMWKNPSFLSKHSAAIAKNMRRKYGDGYSDDPAGALNDYACGGERTSNDYLQLEVVKQAIHVNTSLDWAWCDGAWDKYTSTQSNLMPYYTEWAKKYRILIYYGDADSAVPYNGGEYWTMNIGYDVKEAWRPWTTNGYNLMGGYVQTLDTPYPFTYVTVRGAGHEVPTYKPEQALAMFNLWINNETFPQFTGVPPESQRKNKRTHHHTKRLIY